MIRIAFASCLALAIFSVGCERSESPRQPAASGPGPGGASAPPKTNGPGQSEANATPVSSALPAPVKVDVTQAAMGTEVRIIAFTSKRADEAATRAAIDRAIAEIRRLEDVMTTWRPSEIQSLNDKAGEWVSVGPDSLDVLKRSVWAGKMSKGTFDVTFASLGPLWKFGDAAEERPSLPSAARVAKGRAHIDYRKIEIDEPGRRARIGKDQKIDLGGIAKGHAVDGAARVLRAAGVSDFLLQAGGDLFGSGKKPDGSAWVSGIRDPRGPADRFFATIELTDHAFSTAGDYARSYLVGGKRYHHIIDPRTGYPATASRSVTIWAADAFTADAVDDAVFVLGPKQGLELVESLPDVGAVIVDGKNQVHVSKRLEGKVKILQPPTDAP